MNKPKQERQNWWRSLTLSQQADFVEKKMRQQGKVPDRDWVIRDLVARGQYVGSEKRESIKHTAESIVKNIRSQANQLGDLLDSLDTDTIESLELYDPVKDSIRENFFKAANAMDYLRAYFNDERWAEWQMYREDERKEEKK